MLKARLKKTINRFRKKLLYILNISMSKNGQQEKGISHFIIT